MDVEPSHTLGTRSTTPLAPPLSNPLPPLVFNSRGLPVSTPQLAVALVHFCLRFASLSGGTRDGGAGRNNAKLGMIRRAGLWTVVWGRGVGTDRTGVSFDEAMCYDCPSNGGRYALPMRPACPLMAGLPPSTAPTPCDHDPALDGGTAGIVPPTHARRQHIDTETRRGPGQGGDRKECGKRPAKGMALSWEEGLDLKVLAYSVLVLALLALLHSIVKLYQFLAMYPNIPSWCSFGHGTGLVLPVSNRKDVNAGSTIQDPLIQKELRWSLRVGGEECCDEGSSLSSAVRPLRHRRAPPSLAQLNHAPRPPCFPAFPDAPAHGFMLSPPDLFTLLFLNSI